MRGHFKPHTEETKQKLRESRLGKKMSDETKRKISVSSKGRIISVVTRQRMSIASKGRKMSLEARKKMSAAKKGFVPWHKGKKVPSRSGVNHHFFGKKRTDMAGEKHWHWKGGITPKNNQIRNSLEYRIWRYAVFTRDNFTCVWCGDNKGGNLNADHIKPFAYFPELRFAIDNGRTLCERCHKTTDTYGVDRQT